MFTPAHYYGPYFDRLLTGRLCVLLQREVPEYVNLAIARDAAERGVIVILDPGEGEMYIGLGMFGLCDYVILN